MASQCTKRPLRELLFTCAPISTRCIQRTSQHMLPRLYRLSGGPVLRSGAPSASRAHASRPLALANGSTLAAGLRHRSTLSSLTRSIQLQLNVFEKHTLQGSHACLASLWRCCVDVCGKSCSPAFADVLQTFLRSSSTLAAKLPKGKLSSWIVMSPAVLHIIIFAVAFWQQLAAVLDVA